jgi:hypothetical protein
MPSKRQEVRPIISRRRSGTGTETEANDTLSATGTVLNTGALSITEADDTLSATATVLITGTINITEDADTLSTTGLPGHSIQRAVNDKLTAFHADTAKAAA